MILIVGATGTVGRDVVTRLIERGVPVRAMTRDPERARALPGFGGAEIVAADPFVPETLGPALAGVDKVFFIPPGGPGWNVGQRNVIEAAKQAGIKHLVKVSATCADPGAPSMALSYHYEGEQLLKESGVPFTVLRPSSFMQNFFNYVPSIRFQSTVYMCLGDTRMALVDTRDIADVGVAVLTSEGHEGKTYDITGPESLTYAEAVEKLSAALGRPVQYQDLPPEAYEQALIGMGVPAWAAVEVANIYGRGPYRAGQTAAVASTVQELLGRSARSFAEFARDHAAVF